MIPWGWHVCIWAYVCVCASGLDVTLCFTLLLFVVCLNSGSLVLSPVGQLVLCCIQCDVWFLTIVVPSRDAFNVLLLRMAHAFEQTLWTWAMVLFLFVLLHSRPSPSLRIAMECCAWRICTCLLEARKESRLSPLKELKTLQSALGQSVTTPLLLPSGHDFSKPPPSKEDDFRSGTTRFFFCSVDPESHGDEVRVPWPLG